MTEEAANTTEVAVVGAGPVGLVLALLLDLYGVKATLFNTDAVTRWYPKGNLHSPRTMEHFRKLGIADAVRQLGLPGDHPFDIAYFTRLAGFEIYRGHQPSRDERMKIRAEAPATDQFVEPVCRVNQMFVERFMLDRARQRPNLTMRMGWALESFDQDEAGVTIRARETETGRTDSWRARYLVGCDGSRSTVRNLLGIRYKGEGNLKGVFMGGEFVTMHMRIPTLYRDYLGHRRAWQYLTVNPDTRAIIMTLDGKEEFMMHKPSSWKEASDPKAIAMWIQRAIGVDIPVEVLSHRNWDAGGYPVAEHYSKGRVFLAGDAVHLFTPTGGFGMNSGIDDSANLAWKLAAMLRGWGGPGLAESYELERLPIGIRNTSVSREIGRRFHDIEVPAVIEEDSPAGQAAREEAARHSFVLGNHFLRPEESDWLGINFGWRYDDSPLVITDGPPPKDDFKRYAPSSLPGGRAPHLWLDERHEAGSSLYDRFGLGFALVSFGREAPDVSGFLEAAAQRGIPLRHVAVDHPAARELYEKRLALIRPDWAIAWRGDAAPADPDAVLARVTGFGAA